MKGAGYGDERLTARALSESGVVRGLAELERGGASPYDALNQAWSTDEGAFREVRLGEGGFTVVHLVETDRGDEIPRYGLVDEERKIHLNEAPREALLRLPGVDEGVVAALMDWRDQDDVPEPGGAEAGYYQSLPQPYACKNGPLETVEELRLVRGVTPEILEAVRPYVTVYGDGKVNLNTAPGPVLLTLGLEEALVSKVLRFRRGFDGQEGGRDDGVFEKVSGVKDALADFEGLSPEEAAALDRVLAGCTVQSRHFRVEAMGKTERGAVRKVTAVARREEGGQARILFWHEE
ncbi:MAG: hypothetical protein A3F84_06420 [Candidatus Handelsmanbacteria bacterium RIFCSPLOWO2_12_FULL_64_10]|uniref:T2SS protein K first SAM-like domain-containing protein n=1 Tax=Handelsmanbacteria sp. (strain RIFCSPLOWO2_12_FULL_64_10) TaxID=1817868 RepID=A0A1F6CR05_HANXR|nr:MAG: hypothetical protein A3F84_06420 [Candidatus Handelsmanbacteria bacterium RIFCSPLOWO2_12_FULL_64_10]